MSVSSKIIAAMVILLIVGLSVTTMAEHYSQEGIDANPIVKEMSKRINGFVNKATGGAFGPDAIGSFVELP